MPEQLQVIINAIKDYGAALISTISVGGIAAVASVIIKVKNSISETKNQMSAVLKKKDEESSVINDNYKALMNTIQEQNKRLDELNEQISKVEKN